MTVGDEDGFLPNLTTFEDRVEIATVADVAPEHAQRIAQRFDIDTVYELLSEMLRGDRIEVVMNLALIFVHAKTSMRILRSGRHLLNKKPLTTTLEEAGALIEEAEWRGVVFVCAPPNMFYAQYRGARRLIDEDCIGQMRFARVRSSHGGPGGAPDGWPFDPTWFYQPDNGPPLGIDVYGIHEITSLLRLARRVSAFGGVTETICTVRGTSPLGGLRIPVTTPDSFPLMLDPGNSTFAVIGAIFSVLASKTSKVEVFGRWDAMAIHHRDESPLEVPVQDLEPGVDAQVAPKGLSQVSSAREQEPYHVMLTKHLADCVRSGEFPIADAYKARHTLEIVTVVIELAKSGRVVELVTSFQVIISDDAHIEEAAQFNPELTREFGSSPRTSLGYCIRHNYVLERIPESLIATWAMATLSFTLVRWMPGSPLQAYAQKSITRRGLERQEAFARALPLLSYDPGAPLLDQYFTYLDGLVQDNLGQSIIAPGTSVIDYTLAYLPWTLFSAGLGLPLPFLIGIALGVLIAHKRDRWTDHLTTNISSVLNAVPNYMWAMLVIVVFGIQLRWFNVGLLQGTFTPGVQPGFTAEFIFDALTHAAPPITVYVLTFVGGWILQMKSSTTQVLEGDYAIGTKARGLPGSRIHASYVGRNAILPLFTQFAIRLDFVVGGSTLVEQVFKYDDVGCYLYDVIVARDYLVIQDFVLIITISVVLANLMAGLPLSRIDPRIRAEGVRR